VIDHTWLIERYPTIFTRVLVISFGSVHYSNQHGIVSTPFPHAMRLINWLEYHSKWSLLLTFLVMICLVCVLTSSSADTCSTTAPQSLHFWSVSWLLRVTAGPEAVPNMQEDYRYLKMVWNYLGVKEKAPSNYI